MNEILNYLAAHRIEFNMANTAKGNHAGVVLKFTHENDFVFHTFHFGDSKLGVLSAILSFVYDVNVMLNTDNFKEWEHDFNTILEAKNAYRIARQQQKDAMRVFGDFPEFLFVVESYHFQAYGRIIV